MQKNVNKNLKGDRNTFVLGKRFWDNLLHWNEHSAACGSPRDAASLK